MYMFTSIYIDIHIICIHMYIYIYTYIHIHVCLHIHTCISLCLSIFRAQELLFRYTSEPQGNQYRSSSPTLLSHQHYSQYVAACQSFIFPPSHTGDSNQLEHGHRMICDGFPSFRKLLGLEDGHILTFWLLL